MSDIGAISPGRWHVTQLAERIGATSRVNVGAVPEPAPAASGRAPTAPRSGVCAGACGDPAAATRPDIATRTPREPSIDVLLMKRLSINAANLARSGPRGRLK